MGMVVMSGRKFTARGECLVDLDPVVTVVVGKPVSCSGSGDHGLLRSAAAFLCLRPNEFESSLPLPPLAPARKRTVLRNRG